MKFYTNNLVCTIKSFFKNKEILQVLIFLIFLIIVVSGLNFIGNTFENKIQHLLSYLKFLPQIYRFLIVFFFQEILLLTIMLISFYLLNKNFRFKDFYGFLKNNLNWLGSKHIFKYSIGMYFVYIIITVTIAIIIKSINIQIPGFFGQQEVQQILSKITLNNTFEKGLFFVIVAILGPFVEEIIYRGFIAKNLIKSLGINVGIFLSALIFDFVHMEWAVFGNIFILAYILSYIYAKTNSIIYTFLFHFLVNGLAAIFLIFNV